jgi:hypothetical protein
LASPSTLLDDNTVVAAAVVDGDGDDDSDDDDTVLGATGVGVHDGSDGSSAIRCNTFG